jgi:hypothetical protein
MGLVDTDYYDQNKSKQSKLESECLLPAKDGEPGSSLINPYNSGPLVHGVVTVEETVPCS